MDVLSMSQKGIKNVVASSGTALTSTQVQHIKRLTSNVTLLFDADGAGIKAAMRGLDVCLEKGMKVNVLLLPDGEDPDSFAQSHTLEDIQAYINQFEEDGVFFKGRMLTAEHGTTPQGKGAVIEELAQSIALIEDRITRELYLGELSVKMEVTLEALTQRVNQIRNDRYQEELRSRQRTVTTPQATLQPELPNLSTKAPSGQMKSNVPEPKIKNPFAPYELALMQDLIDYGMTFIPDYQMSTGQIGANGIEVVYDNTLDIREVGGLSENFVLMLDLLMEAQEKNPELEVGKFLTRMENETIFSYADNYVTNKMTLSPIHDKFVGEMEEVEEVAKLLMKDVLSLKHHRVEEQVKSLLREIAKTDQADEKGVKALLDQLAGLNELKSNISRMLGDRPFTSKSKLLN